MDNQSKIDIARRFVELHKNNDVDEWQPLDLSGDDKYLSIYQNLANGIFNNVRLTDDPAVAEMEISKFESIDGTPKIFEFEVELT